MSKLFENHNTGETNDSALSGATWHAQTFTPTISHKITSVKLYLYKVEGPGTLGTVTVSIRAVDENELPTGSDLCSGTFDGTTLSTTPGEWKEITLGAGYNLAIGTKYAIVLRAVAIGAGVALDWWYGGTYAKGQGYNSSNSGSTWTDYSVDFMFEEWGTGIVSVIALNQIRLNGYDYPIKGSVKGAWIDPFPDQLTIGDPDYSNRRDLSSWIINDLRGGIGIEEMDERTDANKCWWTNCIIAFRNHILPPRLATSFTPAGNTITWTDPTGSNDPDTAWADDATIYDNNTATYAYVSPGSGVWSSYLEATIAARTADVVRVWVSTGIPNALDSIEIDVYDTTWHTVWSGLLVQGAYAIYGIPEGVLTITKIRVRMKENAGNQCRINEVDFGKLSGSFPNAIMANFNSNLYIASGVWLYRLNSTRTAIYPVYQFSAAVTALTPSLNSRLYIYLGDSTNYYYMSTTEIFTQSNSANANWGFQFDAKLFKVNTSGTAAYSTDPDGATPTWTSGSAIKDIADQIEGFVIGRDAAGLYTPYAATNSIIQAYDKATPLWVNTEAHLPNHPIGGKGHAYWNGKLYFSYGLGVKEYYPETGSFIDVGVTVRDGLPLEYNGEITKFYGETGGSLFAAVDASITSGNSKSGLYAYNGFGWQCWWADTSNDGAMTDIIVSQAASGYAVYWDCGGKLYYIDIPRGIQNPDKITQSYATAGIFISPWFDAGNPVASKLAKLLADYAKGVSATETVVLKYRLDHTNTDLDTGWTTLDTLNTTAESGYNEELFASGAGASYKAIQFRLDFVTGGSTAKADINALILYFKKRTGAEKLRVWDVTVICDNSLQTSAKAKVANLKTAIESTVDVVFSFHPNDDALESYYVTVDCPEFDEQTGREYAANYNLRLTES